jgi:hypothetical protein
MRGLSLVKKKQMPGSTFFDRNGSYSASSALPKRGLLGLASLEPSHPKKNGVAMIYREGRITLFRMVFCQGCGEGVANIQRDWKTRVVRGGFPDRGFDIEFWQLQGDEAIFRAAWEMVVMVEEFKHGRQPRFERTVTRVQRKES